MSRQHREFHVEVDDVSKLRLYAQSTVSKHQSLDASLAKAAKVGAKKTAGGEGGGGG